MANFNTIPGSTNMGPGQTVMRKLDDSGWQGFTIPVTPGGVGLGNVDNTSDMNKPVSTAQQTAINSMQSNIPTGTTSEYYRGDKSWQTLDKSTVGLSNVDNTSDANKPVSNAVSTALSSKANTSSLATVALSGAYSDLSGKPSLFSGSYTDLTNKPTIPAGQVNSDWNSVSGLSQILNKPTLFSGAYADLTGKPTLFSGAYADLTGKPTLATVATSGSYNDLSNKPTIPTLPTYSQSSVSRTLNSNFQPSTTRNTLVNYSVEIATTLSLSGGTVGTVFLEISADGSTGWTELSRFTNGNTGALTVGLNINQNMTSTLSGTVPAGYYVRLRTVNTTGTPTFTYRSGQETAII